MNKFIFTLCVALIMVFSIISFSTNDYKIDEYYNHIPTLEYILEFGFIEGTIGEGYNAANTPMPYYFVAAFYKILILPFYSGDEFPYLLKFARCTNIIVLLLFSFLLRKYLFQKNLSTLYSVIVICFYPYLLKTGFVYYQSIYGLFFFGLYLIYFEKEGNKSWFFSGLFLTCAILSQQFYLAMIPSKPLYHLFQKYKKSNSLRKILTSDSLLLNSFLYFLPLIFVFILFFAWSGLTHPNFRFHTVVFSPTNITAMLAIVGFTFSPFFLFQLKKINYKRLLVQCCMAILLTIFFSPKWSQGSEPGEISGITFHTLEFIGEFSIVIKTFAQFLLTVVGIDVIVESVKTSKIKLVLIVVIFFCAFTFNAILSERHLLPLIVTMYILLLPRLSEKQLMVWSLLQITIGSIYYYYLFAYNNY